MSLHPQLHTDQVNKGMLIILKRILSVKYWFYDIHFYFIVFTEKKSFSVVFFILFF